MVFLILMIFIVIVSYYFSSKYLTEYQKVSDYAYGQNGLKQNYHKSMQQKQKLQLLEKSPMYALIPEVELDTNLMTLVSKYNGKFQNEVLEIENKFIKMKSEKSKNQNENQWNKLHNNEKSEKMYY